MPEKGGYPYLNFTVRKWPQKYCMNAEVLKKKPKHSLTNKVRLEHHDPL